MNGNSQNQVTKSQQGADTVVLNLEALFSELIDARWIIISVTFAFALFGISYAMLMTPVYKADALIQVEQKSGGGVSALVGDIGGAFSNDSSSSTEIEIIKSRMTLGKTVEQLSLTTVVQPVYIPFVGKGIARIRGEANSLSIGRFDLANGWSKSNFKLVVNDNGFYSVYSERTKEKLFDGKVGELAGVEGIELFILSINAKKNAQFIIGKRSKLKAIQMLQAGLVVTERGHKTGILQMSFSGEDKLQNEAILNDVSENYFLQNVERNFAEAEKSLEFLQGHLPGIKSGLTESENKLNAFRQQNESVDLGMEAQSALQVMVGLEAELNELTFQESELSRRFTKDHPTYKSLLDKRQILLAKQKNLSEKIQELPKTQRDILRMKRDVEVNQQIYIQLLNKSQELSIMKAGTVGNVRILDKAQSSPYAIKPKKTLIVVIATILGGMLSVGLVLIKSFLHKGVENPDEVETIGLPVYASIPKSDWQAEMDAKIKKHKHKHKHKKDYSIQDKLLAESNPSDLSIEALRGLRTSMHFAMMEAKNNVVMISGPAPGIGKSFVSVNFAAVISKSGQKVLLVDADMRKGYLQNHFNLTSDTGLSEMLSGKKNVLEVIKATGVDGLDIVTRGQIPPNPSELLMHPRFKDFVTWASEEYDLILIDTPPVLAVTDPCVVGALAGTTLMVGRFGQNTIKEIDIARQRFEMAGINVKGFILNAVERKASSSYGYGYYNYAYKSDNA